MDTNFYFTEIDKTVSRQIDPMLSLQEVVVDIWKHELGFSKLKTEKFTCEDRVLDRKKNFLDNRIKNNSTIIVECSSSGDFKGDIFQSHLGLSYSNLNHLAVTDGDITYEGGKYHGEVKNVNGTLVPEGKGFYILQDN